MVSSKPLEEDMFTGLVRHLGKVVSVAPQRGGRRIGFSLYDGLWDPPLAVGESVAVNGACLTVVEVKAGEWFMDVSGETLDRTNLGTLKPGDVVNLERSLRVGDPLDGHLVLGHVDTTITLLQVQERGEFFSFLFSLPPSYALYIAEKGAVAINGVSLTVASLREGSFSVVVIPHTYTHTNFPLLRPGDRVNLEVDVLARYVARMMGAVKGGLTYEQLKEAGFL